MQPGYGADARTGDVVARANVLPGIKAIYAVGEEDARVQPFPAPSPGEPSQAFVAPDTDPDKIVYLAFTSGTTGTPEGRDALAQHAARQRRAMVRDWEPRPNTVLLSLSPLSHHIAWVAIAQQMAAGFELVLNDPPPGMKPLDWIVETGATYVMGVPTHAMDILAEQKRAAMDRLGEVRIFYMAGAPIPPRWREAFLAQGIKPQNIYGMTENSSHQYTLPDDDAVTIVATCGARRPGYEVRLFEPENPDARSRRARSARSASAARLLMLGYFDNQSATEDALQPRRLVPVRRPRPLDETRQPAHRRSA